jgi:hypothetical protein
MIGSPGNPVRNLVPERERTGQGTNNQDHAGGKPEKISGRKNQIMTIQTGVTINNRMPGISRSVVKVPTTAGPRHARDRTAYPALQKPAGGA